jgi:hypothetical protein
MTTNKMNAWVRLVLIGMVVVVLGTIFAGAPVLSAILGCGRFWMILGRDQVELRRQPGPGICI